MVSLVIRPRAILAAVELLAQAILLAVGLFASLFIGTLWAAM